MDNNYNVVKDLELTISVELGKTTRKIGDVLEFGAGTVFLLNEKVTEPVKMYTSGKFIGTGEVVVVNDNYAIRVLKMNT